MRRFVRSDRVIISSRQVLPSADGGIAALVRVWIGLLCGLNSMHM